MITTKGAAWHSHYAYFLEKFGPEKMDEVKARMVPGNIELLFGKPIVAISRVSLDAVMDFLVSADKLLGTGDKTLIRESLRKKARTEIKGIYKVFVSILAPETIIRRAANVWKHIYQQGEVAATKKTDKIIEMKITEFAEMPLEHDFSVVVYIEELLRMCNCKNPRSRIIKSYSRGDDQCLFEFEWD